MSDTPFDKQAANAHDPMVMDEQPSLKRKAADDLDGGAAVKRTPQASPVQSQVDAPSHYTAQDLSMQSGRFSPAGVHALVAAFHFDNRLSYQENTIKFSGPFRLMELKPYSVAECAVTSQSEKLRASEADEHGLISKILGHVFAAPSNHVVVYPSKAASERAMQGGPLLDGVPRAILGNGKQFRAIALPTFLRRTSLEFPSKKAFDFWIQALTRDERQCIKHVIIAGTPADTLKKVRACEADLAMLKWNMSKWKNDHIVFEVTIKVDGEVLTSSDPLTRFQQPRQPEPEQPAQFIVDEADESEDEAPDQSQQSEAIDYSDDEDALGDLEAAAGLPPMGFSMLGGGDSGEGLNVSGEVPASPNEGEQVADMDVLADAGDVIAEKAAAGDSMALDTADGPASEVVSSVDEELLEDAGVAEEAVVGSHEDLAEAEPMATEVDQGDHEVLEDAGEVVSAQDEEVLKDAGEDFGEEGAAGSHEDLADAESMAEGVDQGGDELLEEAEEDSKVIEVAALEDVDMSST